KYLGTTDAELLQMVSIEYDTDYNGRSIDELVRRKAVIFAELIKKTSHIAPDAAALLKLLTQNNIRIAICSGATAEDIGIMLAGSGLEKYFSVIVAADDVPKGKPDPAGYTLTLEKLNQLEQDTILPGEAAVIEDSHWGLEAAIAAGMHTIAVAGSYKADELSMAEVVVNNLNEISMETLSGFEKSS
ncbi:MAG: HAD-IA family hydrolase, partial [Planctomycetes bacterium]|nr:HAD-IA family hydrolase [Planctomycetota bacterium]